MRTTNLKNIFYTDKQKQQRGAVSVEYAVVIVFLVLGTLVAILQLVDPTQSVNSSALPDAYNAVSYKIGYFGTIPD